MLGRASTANDQIQDVDLYAFMDMLEVSIAACRRCAGLPLPKAARVLYGAAQFTRQ
jgi:hypothetical protein